LVINVIDIEDLDSFALSEKFAEVQKEIRNIREDLK